MKKIFRSIKSKTLKVLSILFLSKEERELGDSFRDSNITTAKCTLNEFGGYSLSIDPSEIRNSKEFKKLQSQFRKK